MSTPMTAAGKILLAQTLATAAETASDIAAGRPIKNHLFELWPNDPDFREELTEAQALEGLLASLTTAKNLIEGK